VPELKTSTISSAASAKAANSFRLDQLAISPQCGFASDVVGNVLGEDDQKRKLERVVETGDRWG
jgi:5-methyltetrahydropteroyltriglutamate--homocysteine methyltransferase